MTLSHRVWIQINPTLDGNCWIQFKRVRAPLNIEAEHERSISGWDWSERAIFGPFPSSNQIVSMPIHCGLKANPLIGSLISRADTIHEGLPSWA